MRWLGLLALSGCASLTSMGTAETLPQGRTQVTVASEAGLVRGRGVLVPQLRSDVGLRYGVTDDVEIGGQIGGVPTPNVQWARVGADAKVRMVRARRVGGWDLSAAVSVDFHLVAAGGATWQAIGVTLPLFAGWKLGDRVSLLVVPRVTWQHVWSDGAHPIDKGVVGLGLGVAFPVGPNATLVPQVSLGISDNRADEKGGMAVIQAGAGMLFE